MSTREGGHRLMLVMGLTSYHISSNPDYRALFPPGDPVTRGV